MKGIDIIIGNGLEMAYIENKELPDVQLEILEYRQLAKQVRILQLQSALDRLV